jgi:uncharacterized protein YuzE
MVELRTTYDKRADVLYVTTNRNGPAFAREDANGIIWRYLSTDDSLVGATIMDFDAYWKAHIGDLAMQLANRFRVPQTRAKDVLEGVK